MNKSSWAGFGFVLFSIGMMGGAIIGLAFNESKSQANIKPEPLPLMVMNDHKGKQEYIEPKPFEVSPVYIEVERPKPTPIRKVNPQPKAKAKVCERFKHTQQAFYGPNKHSKIVVSNEPGFVVCY